MPYKWKILGRQNALQSCTLTLSRATSRRSQFATSLVPNPACGHELLVPAIRMRALQCRRPLIKRGDLQNEVIDTMQTRFVITPALLRLREERNDTERCGDVASTHTCAKTREFAASLDARPRCSPCPPPHLDPLLFPPTGPQWRRP